MQPRRRERLIGRSVAVMIGFQSLAPVASAQQAPLLEGAPAWQRLIGNTVAASTKAGAYSEYYEPDGTIRHVDADGRTTGHWSTEDERVCFDFPAEDEHTCVQVRVTGDTGRFVDQDGGTDTFTILTGNAKNL